MFSDPIRLASPAWGLKRTEFVRESNYLGIIYLYLKGIVIFLFVNLGLKLFGSLIIFRKFGTKVNGLVLILLTVALLGIVTPLFFLQGGVGWNTIQFFFYASLSLGILLVLLLASLKKRLGQRATVIIMVFVWASFLPGFTDIVNIIYPAAITW